jgi:hypothetical protein
VIYEKNEQIRLVIHRLYIRSAIDCKGMKKGAAVGWKREGIQMEEKREKKEKEQSNK